MCFILSSALVFLPFSPHSPGSSLSLTLLSLPPFPPFLPSLFHLSPSILALRPLSVLSLWCHAFIPLVSSHLIALSTHTFMPFLVFPQLAAHHRHFLPKHWTKCHFSTFLCLSLCSQTSLSSQIEMCDLHLIRCRLRSNLISSHSPAALQSVGLSDNLMWDYRGWSPGGARCVCLQVHADTSTFIIDH